MHWGIFLSNEANCINILSSSPISLSTVISTSSFWLSITGSEFFVLTSLCFLNVPHMPLESESFKTGPKQFLFGMETLTFHINLEGWRSGFEMVSIMPWPLICVQNNYAATIINYHNINEWKETIAEFAHVEIWAGANLWFREKSKADTVPGRTVLSIMNY